jgi:hypothetical protein
MREKTDSSGPRRGPLLSVFSIKVGQADFPGNFAISRRSDVEVSLLPD